MTEDRRLSCLNGGPLTGRDILEFLGEGFGALARPRQLGALLREEFDQRIQTHGKPGVVRVDIEGTNLVVGQRTLRGNAIMAGIAKAFGVHIEEHVRYREIKIKGPGNYAGVELGPGGKAHGVETEYHGSWKPHR